MSEPRMWRQVRRYAVPRRMIEECTKARAHGDWQAACAAGRVDIAFDPVRLRSHFGTKQAQRLAADLAAFAPDLLRWHLPRLDDTRIEPWHQYVLWPASLRGKKTTPLLTVTSVPNSQRLVLDVVPYKKLRATAIHLAPHRWDTRAAADLRTIVGGTPDRLPRFAADGAPLPATQWGVGDDRAGQTERILTLLDREELVTAWAKAGIELNLTGSEHDLRQLDPTALAAEVHWLAAATGASRWALSWHYWARFELSVADTVKARIKPYDSSSFDDGLPQIPPAYARRSPDLDLIWHGRMTPGELHPLVRDALFPGAEPTAEPPPPPAIRVRCGTAWHVVGHDSGRLRIVEHTEDEVRRTRALGKPVSGCFAVDLAWRTSIGRLPKELRRQRQELWLRMPHGGTRTVVDLLDAGMEPGICDGRGRTLLHMLGTYDHRVLLPRLLDAGLDVDARDREMWTPLGRAVWERWPPAAVVALIDAGADPRLRVGDDERSVLSYVNALLDRGKLDREAISAMEYVHAH